MVFNQYDRSELSVTGNALVVSHPVNSVWLAKFLPTMIYLHHEVFF